MFRALYDYGKAHPEILLPPGVVMRTVNFIVELTGDGHFIDIRKAEEKEINCPDVGTAKAGPSTANVLVDKATVSIGLEAKDSKNAQNIAAKRASFIGYFRDGAEKVPEFRAVLTALETEETAAKIREAAIAAKVKKDSSVGFAVDNIPLWTSPAVLLWWTERMKEQTKVVPESECKYLDLITGKPCVPVETIRHMPIVAAGGNGKSTGVSLISFDKRSFCSYKRKKALNSPMSLDTANTIMDAITYLGKRAKSIAGMKFVHWYDKDIPQEYDILFAGLFAFQGDAEKEDEETPAPDEAELEAKATNLVLSPLTGTPPFELTDCTYHIMILKPDSARMTVNRYMVGSYGELYRNLKAWYEDMSLVSWDGKKYEKYKSILGLELSLLSETERSKAKKGNDKDGASKYPSLSSLMAPILRACLENKPLPYPALTRALSRIKSNIYADEPLKATPFQILKLWLIRNQKKKEESELMPEVNVNMENIGYKCGRLMAVYEAIQRVVAPDVKADVLTRYYSACSQAPSLTLGRLQMLSNHHLDKVKSQEMGQLFRNTLGEIYGGINCEIPKYLPVEDQAYFAVGYWQQAAATKKALDEIREAIRNRQKEKSEQEDV